MIKLNKKLKYDDKELLGEFWLCDSNNIEFKIKNEDEIILCGCFAGYSLPEFKKFLIGHLDRKFYEDSQHREFVEWDGTLTK